MQLDMTKGEITPILFKFMIPLFIGDIFQRLYNIADTIIVGRYVGEKALAAVGATGGMMFLSTGFAIGITAGITVLTSQRFGADDEKGVKISVANGIILSLILTAALTCIFLLAENTILKWMNTPEDILGYARTYITIIFQGTFCTVFYNLFSAYLRSVGNSRAPLFFLIFSGVLNVILDLIFIIVFKIGVAGAAYATILAQGISVILCVIYIFWRVPILIPKGSQWKPSGKIIGFQIKMGIPMALQYAITDSGIIIMQTAINGFGSTAVAAYTAASKIENVLMQGMIAMGQTMATFCGQNMGANKLDRIRQGVKTAVKIEIIYSLIAAVLFVFPLEFLMRLFFSGTANFSAMMPWARTYAVLCSFFFIPLSFIFIFRSGMEGCGYAMLPLLCGIGELIARGVTALIGIHLHSYLISCACDPAAWVLAGIISTAAFYWMLRDIERKNESKNLTEI